MLEVLDDSILGGICIWTSSSSSPFSKTFLMSSDQSKFAVKEIMT